MAAAALVTVGLAAVALASLASSRRSGGGASGVARPTAPTSTSATSGGIPVTYDEKRPGIVDSLDDEARARAVAFAGEVVRAGLPRVTFTSGRRSPEWQADAMIAKVRRGEDITKLYRSSAAVIRHLLTLPLTVEAWAPVLAANPVSDHQRGRAADVRRWGYTAAQLDQLQAIARQCGWRPLLESDHLHIEL